MKRLRGLCLSLAGLMLMTTPALAADYNFETPAPKDFYTIGEMQKRGADVRVVKGIDEVMQLLAEIEGGGGQ